MRYVQIPGTNLKPSVICLGTASYGTAISEEDTMRLLDSYVEHGGTFLDTAHIYGRRGDETSISEKTIGRWLAQRGKRDRIVLATKGATLDTKTREPRVTPEFIRSDLEESLGSLGVETIDLYWLHRDDPTRPVAPILEALEGHRAAGKIRYYACSNWSTERMREAQECAQRHAWSGFVASQVRWSLAEENSGVESDKTMVVMDDAMQEYHRANKIAAVPYSSQAMGFFGGKYDRHIEEPDSPRGKSVVARYYNEANFRRLDVARSLAERHGCSANEIALAYLIHQLFPVYPIVGCRTEAQVEDSCRAAAVELSDEEFALLTN